MSLTISVCLFILAWIQNTTASDIIPGEISKQKCKAYSKEAFADQKKTECGFGRDDILSAGTYRNDEAHLKEFPHQALLGYESAEKSIVWLCGGSMISEQYILTVAHCLRTQSHGGPKYVKMGTINGNDTSQSQTRTISEIILHPDYKPTSFYNDIGLVKSAKPFEPNPYIRPACLFTSKEIPVRVRQAVLTRWDVDVVLHRAMVILDPTVQNQCNESYTTVSRRELENGIQNDKHLCAKPVRISDNSCGILSGNPLQVLHERVSSDDIECMYDIIGISSFGRTPCALAGYEGKHPDVYTKVSGYIGWIESTVWPEEIPSSPILYPVDR